MVTDAEGTPVVGATLHADGEPPCDAVTGADGHFRAPCPTGARTFTVRHPALLPSDHPTTVEGHGDVVLPTFVGVRVPTEAGVHALVDGHFSTPPAVGLVRSGDDTSGYSWCLPKQDPPAALPAGTLKLLDNHVSEWRLYRMDEKGCVYRLTPTPGGFWEYASDPVPVTRLEPFAPGRDWLTVELTAGDYVLADWMDGGFVPDGDSGKYRAEWIHIGG